MRWLLAGQARLPVSVATLSPSLRERMDVRHVNGGVFLGLDGVVIKSHGGMDAVGTAGAIDLGYAMVRHELLGKIRDMVASSLARPSRGAAGEAGAEPSTRARACEDRNQT